ncbi:glycosyl hydrolase catalytic core-domain-containing protein [Lineolata rhizophorae]|uniref:Glycosyl hydrolase catalytic core-domain-containing protein n=1 Tax=Lineolata rhizophorae TaxID=578093 RepID=A0A6A6NU77_9PEZI|nr:glycosyl hydrolase catalytic core-domain-containing protein [Lineolata rhizophorae]
MLPATLLTIVISSSPLLVHATSSTKRGLCYVPSDEHASDDDLWTASSTPLTWYYNYQSTPSSALSSSGLTFVPMLWGATDGVDSGFYSAVKAQLDAGEAISHVLGFNEPDGESDTGGSDMPAAVAARAWQAELEPLRALGVKLGAPAVTGSPGGLEWLDAFFEACDGGCAVDFVPVHWYGNFEGLASHLGQVRERFENKSIWVTEYNLPDAELDETQEFYNMSAEYFDRLDYVTHYSLFGAFRSDDSNVGPNGAMLDSDGDLTDIGSWYLGGAATGNEPDSASAKLGAAAFAGWGVLLVAVAGAWSLL